MYLDRMQWLIEAVKSAPDDNFDMRNWECGTSHCAGGWLCLDPRAQQLGLCLGNPHGTYITCMPHYKCRVSFGALANFLGISMHNSCHIFDPFHYETHPIKKSTVLRHIRRVMVDEKERIVECP